MSKIFLSIIICTYNRGKLLINCLDSLLKQSINEGYEILVIDNNSNDDTEDIVGNFIQKTKRIRYFFEKEQGLSHARNRGCLEARGKYLCYLDDDAMAPYDYILNIINVLEKYKPDFLGGPVYPYYTTKKPFWFKDEYEIKKYVKESGFSLNCNITGANYTVKKEVLMKLGLFNPDFGMKGNKLGLFEEHLVLRKYRDTTPIKNQKVFYSLECFIKHHTPKEKMKLGYMVKRYFKVGAEYFPIYLEYNKKECDNISILNIFIKLFLIPYDILKRFLNEIKSKGFKDALYLKPLLFSIRDFARYIELLKYKMKSQRNLFPKNNFIRKIIKKMNNK